jgi:hypothetical protein
VVIYSFVSRSRRQCLGRSLRFDLHRRCLSYICILCQIVVPSRFWPYVCVPGTSKEGVTSVERAGQGYRGKRLARKAGDKNSFVYQLSSISRIDHRWQEYIVITITSKAVLRMFYARSYVSLDGITFAPLLDYFNAALQLSNQTVFVVLG